MREDPVLSLARHDDSLGAVHASVGVSVESIIPDDVPVRSRRGPRALSAPAEAFLVDVPAQTDETPCAGVFGTRGTTDGKRRDGSMEILVVCGAGASSTFVALRLRRSAAERGIELSARAGSLELLESSLPGADLVLVGPHLAPDLDEIRAVAHGVDASTRVVLLPESAVTSRDGAIALQTALDAAGVGS